MSLPAKQVDGHLIRCEVGKKHMAKAVLPEVTFREDRKCYGQILKRAREIAGMNRDEAARALGNVDPAQVTRWESGEDNGQTWRYWRHPALRQGYLIAQGQADGAVLELKFRIQRAEAV